MSHLYYVMVKYHNITFKALIDSGAQISIISRHMLQKLGLHTNLQTIGYVHGINGKDKMMGHVDCHINLISHHLIPVHVQFTVILHSRLIILGLDFLEKYQCLIDCHHKTLNIQHHKIPLYNKEHKLLTKNTKQFLIKNKLPLKSV